MAFKINYSHKEEIEILKNVIRITFVTFDNSRSVAQRFPLLFDTGAFITLIRKDRAILNGYKIYEKRGCVISGFSEKGLVCDLRIIPSIVFCGFRITDVLVATPCEDGISITEVLGMNILENFRFGMDFEKEEIYLNKRKRFISQKPKYSCGSVSFFEEGITENYL